MRSYKMAVYNVTKMNNMFRGAVSFNQPVDSWDTSNATDMSHMFRMAKSFNQPLGKWNTAKVKNFSRIFEDAVSFRQIWADRLNIPSVSASVKRKSRRPSDLIAGQMYKNCSFELEKYDELHICYVEKGCIREENESVGGVIIGWSCPHIGFGQYVVWENKKIDSECMEGDNCRAFSVAVLRALRREHKTGSVKYKLNFKRLKRRLGLSCSLENYILKECKIID